MVDVIPDRPHKGRGAVGNPAGRFEMDSRVTIDDGWGSAAPHPDDDTDPPSSPATITIVDATRTILNRNDSPDIPFDQSINVYRGCEHGCIYCYARPSHGYYGMSTGLDFETKIMIKPEAATLLTQELRKPAYRPAVIAMGSNTDPYQPLEKKLRLTRAVIEVLAAHNHPFSIVTKSALVMRDIDLLAPLAKLDLVRVFVSVTTLDRHLANKMEPRASTPTRRLAAIAALAEAGVPVGVMSAPMIPMLNDGEMEAILEAAHKAGAVSAGYTLMRLPHEIKDLFQQWLETHAPNKAKRVLDMVRDTRAGKLNDPRFGTRMRGEGVYADLLRKRFQLAVTRLGLNRNNWRPDLTLFKRPPQKGDQLSLL